ncbi:MAG: bifunctional 4-hydroxy-2-oxoglutarate aldolase/2-dehydro-3-deoxy-phosphogluconate aldolase [Christensenellales bacterium]
MLSHHEALTQIKAAKLVAILRHVPADKLDGVVEALIAGGVRVLEFTFDHDSAECVKENAEKIRHTAEKYGDRVLVGCGTALTVQEVEAACDAGACLVISPNVDYGVIRRTRQLGMVSMPGALTPTEIVAAHGAGADIVKLFPAGTLGVSYTGCSRPLAYIDMSAVGGVARKRRGVSGCGRLRLRRRRQLVLPDAVKTGDFAAIQRARRRLPTRLPNGRPFLIIDGERPTCA